MAITVGAINLYAGSSTSSSTVSRTLITAAVGDFLIVSVVADNNGTNGASSISSVTDSAGNTYTNRGITNYDPGAAADGVTLGIFTTTVTSALSSGTITANFSPNTRYKTIAVWILEPTSGYTIQVREVGSGATGNEGSVAPTLTSGSLSTDDIIFGFTGWESYSTSGSPVYDSDTTRGTWTGNNFTRVSGGSTFEATNQRQYKVVTSAGTQTWNTSMDSANPDYAHNYIVVYESLDEPTYSLVGEGGTYEVSESEANLAYSTILVGSTASYSVTGTTATLVYSKAIVGDTGSYSVAGSTAGTNVGGAPSGFTIPADGGSYSISGTDATYDRNYVVVGSTASYSVVGEAADTRKGQTVAAGSGSYSVSGTANSFKYGYVVAANTNSYSVSGTNNNFLYGKVMVAATASYSVTGQDMTMSAGQIRLNAEAGSYVVTGDNAGLYPAPAAGTELRGPDPRISFWSNPDGLVLSFPYGYSFAKYVRRPYNVNGNGNLFISTDVGSGIFDVRGHLRVTIVDGSTYTGIYAADGSVNAVVVNVDDVDPDQLFHSSGALRISQATADTPGLINQNNGSLLVANIP